MTRSGAPTGDRYSAEAPPFSWLRHRRAWGMVGLGAAAVIAWGVITLTDDDPACDEHVVVAERGQTLAFLNVRSESLTEQSLALNIEADPDFDAAAIEGESVIVCVDPAELPPPTGQD